MSLDRLPPPLAPPWSITGPSTSLRPVAWALPAASTRRVHFRRGLAGLQTPCPGAPCGDPHRAGFSSSRLSSDVASSPDKGKRSMHSFTASPDVRGSFSCASCWGTQTSKTDTGPPSGDTGRAVPRVLHCEVTLRGQGGGRRGARKTPHGGPAGGRPLCTLGCQPRRVRTHGGTR